jgi:type II secretory pathway predicted ATPase ExeA
MSHYAGFEREPFSNSPDPGFLLGTRQHATCLQELEISLRLRRGLNLVTGDIGTGKTTLCRSLLRAFAEDQDADVHLLLDPHFDSSEEFLQVILASVTGRSPDTGMGLWALKEPLKQQLFRLGLVEKRLVVLIIDEGQKIAPDNLEILREMLNYETNTAKLLQIVLFGQRELEPGHDAMPNLADRINVRRRLKPLSARETVAMIEHRLAVAAGDAAPAVRFTPMAGLAGHLASGGSPRKTLRLCHLAMLETLVRGRARVGLAEVLHALRSGPSPTPRRRLALAGLAALCLALGGLWLSLDAQGPVMRAAQARTESAPATSPALAPAVDASPGISTAGLRLGDDETDAQEPGARPNAGVSLLPPRDSGPSMRKAVEFRPFQPEAGQADAGRENAAERPAPARRTAPEPAPVTHWSSQQASLGPEALTGLARPAPGDVDRP